MKNIMKKKNVNLSQWKYLVIVLLICLNGCFSMDVHKELFRSSIHDESLSKEAIEQMQKGITTTADVKYRKISAVHMDNMTGTFAISKAYKDELSKFDVYLRNKKYEEAGVALHTITDFYSHSNYIPLYKLYAEANGKSLYVKDIPIFSEAMNDAVLMSFIEDRGGLRTGTYGDGIFAFLKDKFTKDIYSHGQMNLDSNKSTTGKLPYNNYATMHDAAKATAHRDLDMIANSQITVK